MKIALVNKIFSLSHGGAERYSVNLATTLHGEGHEVHVFANQAIDLPAGISVHLVPMAKKPTFWRIVSFARNVRRELENEKFDIVYGLTQIFPQNMHRIGGGIHRHWMRVRYPFWLSRWFNYLVNPAHLANIYLESQIFQPGNYDRIVAISDLCKDHACRYYGVPGEKVEVIYNGVDHGLFNPEKVAPFREKVRGELGLGADDVAILFISSNWKRKGLAVILRAVALLGAKGRFLHVIVVGRGRPAPFEKLARKLGLEDRVHFVGATSEVQRYFGAGDLLALPTLYDAFANVYLEAMACGLPVIASSAAGAAEIVRGGENGYVQRNPEDDEELSDLFERCLDPGKLQEMGDAARKTSMEFTLERNMSETLTLFRQVSTGKNL